MSSLIYFQGYILLQAYILYRQLGDELNEIIIHDPRLTRNSFDIIKKTVSDTIQSNPEPSFINEPKIADNAIYEAEIIALQQHSLFHLLRQWYDPMVMIADLVSTPGNPLSKNFSQRMMAYSCNGEINFKGENI